MLNKKNIIEKMNTYFANKFNDSEAISNTEVFYMNQILMNIKKYEDVAGERPVMGLNTSINLSHSLQEIRDNLIKDTFLIKNGFGVNVKSMDNVITIELLNKEGESISSAEYMAESGVNEEVDFDNGDYYSKEIMSLMKFDLTDSGVVKDFNMPVTNELMFPYFYGNMDNLFVAADWEEGYAPLNDTQFDGMDICKFEDFDTKYLMGYFEKNEKAINEVKKEVAEVMNKIADIDKRREIEKESTFSLA